MSPRKDQHCALRGPLTTPLGRSVTAEGYVALGCAHACVKQELLRAPAFITKAGPRHRSDPAAPSSEFPSASYSLLLPNLWRPPDPRSAFSLMLREAVCLDCFPGFLRRRASGRLSGLGKTEVSTCVPWAPPQSGGR